VSFSSSIQCGDDIATTRNTVETPALDSPFSLDGILAEANERQRAHEFCVLVGNTLWSYSDAWAYAKGDPPTSEIWIVGASAWNPPSVTRNPNSLHKFASPPSVSFATNASLASEAFPTPNLISSKSVDFLIVTYSGTHVRCSTPTPLDKDEWLAALHAGLEGNIMENRVETLMVLSKRHKVQSKNVSHQRPYVGNNSRGLRFQLKADMMVQSAIASAVMAFQAEISFRPFVPPLPRLEVNNNARYEGKNKTSSTYPDGDTSTSHVYGGCGCNTDATPCLPTTGYHSPCDDWSAPLSDTHCTACGRYPPEHAMRIDAAPLPEYGMEVRVDLCHDCWIAQGVLRHVRYLGWLYEVEARDRAAIRMAWDEVKEVMDRLKWENAGLKRDEPEIDEKQVDGKQHANAVDPFSSGLPQHNTLPGDFEPPSKEEERIGVSQSAFLSLSSDAIFDATSVGALLELVNTENFVAYRQRSNTLDSLCHALETGGSGSASDFLESVGECAQAAEISCFYRGEQEKANETRKGIFRPKEKNCLKKEAFKVAGDMSAALKLLYEYALPPERKNLPPKSHHLCFRGRDNADMLAAILEFFLDLCDEGQIDAVAFFWPQLCHIHMQMLPPRDTEEMVRVELMEDFLLTVATRYSVHLALDLVWGLKADLEESLGSSNCNSLGRRRRFAILRFVSELESLLFDFDGGWGGGGVSLHGMLSPSQHQAALLRDAMSLLQLRRRFGSHYLTRSVRLDKLRAEALESLDFPPNTTDVIKVRALIAKNAAYFSTHIAFARKLGDIAEKLRFMRPDQRPGALREELKEINTSGTTLGGDPLNRLCRDGLFRKTVHIPINEGHVFRSKERTPVLLLTEIVKDRPEMRSVMTTQNVTDIAGTNIIEENGNNLVSHDRKQNYNDGNECSDDHLLQGPLSPSSMKNTLFDQDESENESSSCPGSPTSTQRTYFSTSTDSAGRRKSHCNVYSFLTNLSGQLSVFLRMLSHSASQAPCSHPKGF